MGDWPKYHNAVGDTHSLLVAEGLQHHTGRRLWAFDLGAGNMRDSRYLLKQGFESVVAVDMAESSVKFVVPGIQWKRGPIETFVPVPGAYDFGIAHNALFFLTLEQTCATLKRAYMGLCPTGVFAFNLLGDRCDWVKEGRVGITHLKPEDADLLRCEYHPIVCREIEWDAPDIHGVQKHWHTWNFIVRRP